MPHLVIDDTTYEIVPLLQIDLLQMAQACRELGTTPEAMGAAIRNDDESSPDRLLALAIIVWASRVAAGEDHPTVASAVAGVPMRDIDWQDDDEPDEPEEEPEGPTVAVDSAAASDDAPATP